MLTICILKTKACDSSYNIIKCVFGLSWQSDRANICCSKINLK